MTRLVKSQFFFLCNGSISSAVASCGCRTAVASASKRSTPSQLVNQAVRKIRFWQAPKPTRRSMSTQAAARAHGSFVTPPVGFLSKPGMAGSAGTYPMSGSSLFPTVKTQSSLSRLPSHLARRFNSTVASPPSTPVGAVVKARRPPINSSKATGYWLVGSAGLVFGIVILGGLTRLTESGLSITEWRPITGSLPPMNDEDWNREFNLYRESPEFKLLNSNITMEEYKFIYFMEWSHRLWGRMLGLVFVVPAAYFVFARRTSAHTTKRLILISGLLGLQGFIGWWMVKSGLDQKLVVDGAHPRVSQYRLATHLGAAFLLYMAMISTGLDVLRENRWIKNPQAALKELTALSSPVVTPLRRAVTALACLAFFTSMTGAFVAGLDAGMIYNSFPYMGDTIVPKSTELFNPTYASNPGSQFNVWWKNMLENPTTVQFNHRVMACTTWAATVGVHLYSLRFRAFVPRSVIRAGAAAVGFVTLQAALGISTLIYVVPTPLAASHQAGSLAFLTAVLVFAARLRLPRPRMQWLVSTLSKTKSAPKATAVPRPASTPTAAPPAAPPA